MEILTNNLFFKSKLSSLKIDKDIIIVDADHPDALNIVSKNPFQSYVFVSHVNVELIKKFKDTGCKHVYARSYFFGNLGTIFS